MNNSPPLRTSCAASRRGWSSVVASQMARHRGLSVTTRLALKPRAEALAERCAIGVPSALRQ
ncbi:hypothetical protein D3C72_2015670 [compost metagenome]